jgi:hypothetical protein
MTLNAICSEGATGGVGVGDQQRLRIGFRQQVFDQLGHRQGAAAGDGIDGLSAAVARCQDAVEVT